MASKEPTARRTASKSASPRGGECVLVLQGGGALGAYQGGVYESLCAGYGEPGWLAGISIGAINAALIAGNPPEMRVARLRAFWETVSSVMPFGFGTADPHLRALLNAASATHGMLMGVPGFFTPRLPPPPLQRRGTPAAISFYDTAPLRRTLEQLVDFDRINAGGMRLSVGAVNVRSGNFAYFDSATRRIDARHVLASGALPPGFPPIEIDGEHYWDGGLVSNTPLQYVLDQACEHRRVVFQVDLFAAGGDSPKTLDEVSEREKDIRFSSRTRLNTTHALERQRFAQSARRLLDKLPPELRATPEATELAQLARPCAGVDVVHLIYRSKHDETQSKDYDFSRRSMEDHWQAGRNDMSRTLQDPRWTDHAPTQDGVHVFDLIPPHSATRSTRP